MAKEKESPRHSRRIVLSDLGSSKGRKIVPVGRMPENHSRHTFAS